MYAEVVISSCFVDAINGDADAIIVLQNMGAQNFVNEDKSIGFDTMTTLAVLKVQ